MFLQVTCAFIILGASAESSAVMVGVCPPFVNQWQTILFYSIYIDIP